MPRLGVLLVIAAGAGFAGYGYLFPESDTSTDLAEVTRISSAPDRAYGDDVIRSFAPSSSASRAELPATPVETAALPSPKPSTWTTVVLSGQSVVTPIRSMQAADPATRLQLARDLQRELRRVGCYQGEITGSWNAATRRAMANFMDRANAVLPDNEPDYVLLALVQSHQEIACAAGCPAGQTMNGGGRCVPNAIFAQAEKKTKRLEERRLAQARLADHRERGVATSRPEILPWLRNDRAAGQPAEVAVAVRPEPLPGRMSIGGPAVVDSGLAARTPDIVPSSGWSGVATSTATTPTNIAAGGNTSNPSSEVAVLQAGANADDSSAANSALSGDMPPLAVDAGENAHKTNKSRRSDNDRRSRGDGYASTGRRRHGDPRPGTMQYNIVQSLGGIY